VLATCDLRAVFATRSGSLVVCAAESSDFDYFAANTHVHYLKAAADNPRATKNTSYLLGSGAGSHIEILRQAAQEQIAHTTTDQIGFVIRFLKLLDNLQGRRTNVFA